MGDDGSDDEDYMSDKFLNPPVKPVCSGLISKSAKGRVEEGRTKVSKTAPRGKQMVANREEGLKKPIGEDNIGFKMLMKMGFKGDGGLGKKAEGRSEPVPIEVIEGRRGLGLHNVEKKFEQLRQQREQCLSSHQSDFRATMASRFRLERAQRQLLAARHICKRLDISNSLEEPVDSAFWPPDEIRAKLLAQSRLIRREICRSERPRGFWNKRPKYDADNSRERDRSREGSDLEEFGDEYRGEYDKVLGVESDEEEYCDIDAAQHGPVESQPDVILSRLTNYLREKHFYCFWCGAQFYDEADLLTNCPGPTEDDHG
nr:D111 G patch [Hymenolepis microstoma]